MSDEAEKTREAFFAKLADPPSNVAAAPAEEAPEEESPKSESTGVTPEKVTSRSSDANTAASSSAKADSPVTGADREAAILAALRDGDLDTLAELTDQDPAAFDEKSTKWAARNRRETKLKNDLAKVKANAEAVVAHYAPLDERLERYQADPNDLEAVVEILELVTGEKRAAIIPKLAQLGAVGERVERLVERRAAGGAAADRALREAVADDVPDDHQVRKLPDWEDAVVAVLRESVDEYTGEPSISFKQAAARVVRREKDRLAKLSKAFGAEPAPAAPRPGAPERAAGAAPAPRRARTKEEFFASFK